MFCKFLVLLANAQTPFQNTNEPTKCILHFCCSVFISSIFNSLLEFPFSCFMPTICSSMLPISSIRTPTTQLFDILYSDNPSVLVRLTFGSPSLSSNCPFVFTFIMLCTMLLQARYAAPGKRSSGKRACIALTSCEERKRALYLLASQCSVPLGLPLTGSPEVFFSQVGDHG